MSDNPIDKDIRDVIAEEKSRGKHRVDVKARKERAELLRYIRDALELKTEREFLEAIRQLQLGDDPKKLENALKIWRSFSSLSRK
jgi:uncharacterized protein YpiB (UPF0302 family)